MITQIIKQIKLIHLLRNPPLLNYKINKLAEYKVFTFEIKQTNNNENRVRLCKLNCAEWFDVQFVFLRKSVDFETNK